MTCGKLRSGLSTGGGSGLGAATARAMAAKGARVAVLDLNKADAETVAGEIGGIAIAGDVTSEEQVKAAVAQSEDAKTLIALQWLALERLAGEIMVDLTFGEA